MQLNMEIGPCINTGTDICSSFSGMAYEFYFKGVMPLVMMFYISED